VGLPVLTLAGAAPNTFLLEMSTPATSATEPSPAALFVDLLEAHGVTHVLTVPDNTSAALLAALEKRAKSAAASGDGGTTIRVIYATREGEAIGVASGLWLGGALPVVLIQNTGLLEAGDGLRGTAARMGAPISLLVTCRGYAKARGLGLDPSKGVVDRDTLVRSDLDSVAHMTETTLDAWGIPFRVLRDPSDLAPISEAFRQAREEERPVAVLLDTAFE
jgi:sulfopyruvate decarboxylase subunit alpha